MDFIHQITINQSHNFYDKEAEMIGLIVDPLSAMVGVIDLV